MSADPRHRRMAHSYTRINNSDPGRENVSVTNQSTPLRSLNNNILFATLQSNLSDLDNDTRETFNEEFGIEEAVPRMYQQELMVSTSTLAVSYCVIICFIFVLINAQAQLKFERHPSVHKLFLIMWRAQRMQEASVHTSFYQIKPPAL